jgi:peptidoglycan/xylan/chitin deacetylase (PgdA/CDA1 family)
MSLVVKAGKAGKKVLKKFMPPPVQHLSYTRRLEQVATQRRVVAMTFDDGPMDLPAVPDKFQGTSLTDILLDTLAHHNAKGTFDVVGDTGENYPDKAGRTGQADWGGVKYDHYPDINQDERGGVLHNPRLTKRILDEGHQIANHGYRHILFGKKPFVYGKRVFFTSFDQVVADQKRLDDLLRREYGYTITMGRPPHYVDQIAGGFTSYDVYNEMNYQYLAAPFDGAGWLPLNHGTPEASFQAEVEAMVTPLEKALAENPDALCGKIIFQKDGYNMARRTPVALGLGRQLEILDRYGYQVVTAQELMAESPFKDLGRDDPDFDHLAHLQESRGVVFSDNTLRLDQTMTWGELAMLLAPRSEAISRRRERIQATGKPQHAYWGAMDWCAESGILKYAMDPDAPVTSLPTEFFTPTTSFTRRAVYRAFQE